MKRTILEEIYHRLYTEEAVFSVSEFCREWLGVERSYMAVLAAKHRTPSAKVLMTCAKRLNELGKTLAASKYPCVSARGRRLQDLASECVGEVWAVME